VAVAGILGGVFDPPHDGHVALARAAVAELGLEHLLVLVVADPGHKHAATPPETRLGTTCRTAGGRPLAGPASFRPGAMLSSLNMPCCNTSKCPCRTAHRQQARTPRV